MKPLDGLLPVGRDGVEAVTALFAQAFHDNPMFAHVLPDERLRRRTLPAMMRPPVSMAAANGGLFATSAALEGAIFVRVTGQRDRLPGLSSALGALALLLRPGLWPMVARFVGLGPATTVLQRTMRLLEPALAVELVAVAEAHRGQGHMGVLMRAALRRADELGLRCVLETESPRNVQIYEHYGFRLHSAIQAAPGKVTYYVMTREPGEGEKHDERTDTGSSAAGTTGVPAAGRDAGGL